jgi:hypothetical protein
MKHLFAIEDISNQLREIGFNENCIGLYDSTNNICTTGGTAVFKPEHPYYQHTAILYQQIFDWFREKHNLIIAPHLFPNVFIITIISNPKTLFYCMSYKPLFITEKCESYEEARKQAIEQAIKIVKENK